ncbi:MAG: hypothetical protein WBO32_04860 [Cyclobacteriaceae bacterium]
MKKTIITIALGAFTFMIVSCASQDNQASSNQRPTGQQTGQRQGGPPNFSQMLTEMDANNDGKLAKSEVKGPLVIEFSTIDANGDGFLTESEMKNAPRPQRSGPRQ